MSEQSLAGKVAVVTGASKGIGRAIAVAMAREGADLVVTARSTDRLEELAGEAASLGRSCLVVTADMTQEAEVRQIAERALAEYGKVDVLVNNAATIYPKTNLVDFDFADWRSIIEVNFIGVAALCQAVLPAMIERGADTIINFTACLAGEVTPLGIDVNCINPGGVETEGFRGLFGARSPGAWEPMPAQAIADVALFLASDRSVALKGTSIDAFGSSSPIFR